jgi:nucleoside-diphosphate-sugar epimerase
VGAPGVSSFIHIDDAAATTLAAIESAKPGLYNIVDDDPAPVVEWLPALAEAIRQASPGSPRVAGSPVRRRTRGGHDDGGTRGLQRQGKARPRVAALLPELERRGSGGARKLRSSKAA